MRERLEKLRDVPWENRGAHFTSAVVAAQPDLVLFTAQEEVAGRIALEMRGPNGFGYDPVFLVPALGAVQGGFLPDAWVWSTTRWGP